MKEAAFSLIDYSIIKAMLNLEDIPTECTFELDFSPSGIYNQMMGNILYSLFLKQNMVTILKL